MKTNTKVFALDKKGAAALITAALLAGVLLFTGCPQTVEGGGSPATPSGPDPNLLIEGGVLKWCNKSLSGALVIPANVTEIADNAFKNCKSLTQVNFSQCTALTKIGRNAFSGCTGLTSLTLPANLETLAEDAFSGCTEIKNIGELPATLKAIGDWAFDGCNKVTSFDFRQCTALTFIGEAAFRGCTHAEYKVKNNEIKNLLLNSQSGIDLNQIIEE